MVEINLDSATRGVNFSGARVFECEEFSVRSGLASEGNDPVIEFFFKSPRVVVRGGAGEKGAWNSLLSDVDKEKYAWSLLLASMTRANFEQILAETRTSAHDEGLAEVKASLRETVESFVSSVREITR